MLEFIISRCRTLTYSKLAYVICFIINYVTFPSHSGLLAQQVFVSSVIDGDTFKDSLNNSYRLIGIDAPERNTAEGQRSKKFLEDLIFERNVLVRGDSINDSLDFYGRTLCYVYLNNADINEFMIKSRQAWLYTKFKFIKQDQYKKAQDESLVTQSVPTELKQKEVSSPIWTTFLSRRNIVLIIIVLSLLAILFRFYFR